MSRAHFIDNLRVFAFVVLLLIHTSLAYSGNHWVVNFYSKDQSLFDALYLALSPWRMPILFYVSGFVFRFDKVIDSSYFIGRSKRLLVPLIFGIFFVVPPQFYFESINSIGYKGSYFDFLESLFYGHGYICWSERCVRSIGWKHLWFLAFLWVYTIILLFFYDFFKSLKLTLCRCDISPWMYFWALTLLYFLLLIVNLLDGTIISGSSISISKVFGYLVYFLLGVLTSGLNSFWSFGRKYLRLFFAIFIVFVAFFLMGGVSYSHHVFVCLYVATQLFGFLFFLFFFYSFLSIDAKCMKLVSGLVFPFYILHQTLIVIIGEHLANFGWVGIPAAFLTMFLTLALAGFVVVLAALISPGFAYWAMGVDTEVIFFVRKKLARNA